jgi:hypothetical protein
MNDLTNMSPSIGNLAAALAAAQGEITGALKDSANPFFKSKYADLAACWDACRGPLSKHGLAVIQTTQEATDSVKVITTLAHKSGEWMRGELVMTPVKFDPQGIGSCITYARRYALAAMVGLAQIDDDANAASGRDGAKAAPAPIPIDPKRRDEFVKAFTETLKEDMTEEDKGRAILEIHNDLNRDQDLYGAVWKEIDATTRRAIKGYIEQGKKAAA